MNGSRLALLSFALCALCGCLATEDEPAADDPVDDAVAELGVPIAGCAGSGFVSSSATLTLNVGAQALVFNAPSGKLTANGYVCKGVVAGTNQALTTSNVAKIRILGDGSDNKVVLDFQPGSFGPKILSALGGITVDFAANGGGDDSLMLRAGKAADTYKLGKSTTTSDVYIDVTADKIADIDVKPGASFAILASMGAGNDTITASPLASELTSFAGANVTIGPLTWPLTAYGGLGDDKFTGGTGDDTFSGGDGNDLFKAGAYPDGNDIYTGDNGIDTVDYSVRTAALKIDIGPAKVASTGLADMGKLDYSQLAGTTLIFALDGGNDFTATFTAPTKPSDVLTAINQAAGASVATLTGLNQLTISSTTRTANSSVEIDSASSSIGLFDLQSGISSADSAGAPIDDDDGQTGETDDVRSSIENITAGSGNDTLIGDGVKNVIKGGAGDDKISGGWNSCGSELTAASGDSLQGEVGDDVFYMPAPNCWASLVGSVGNNTADFSARSVALTLSSNGIADDGAGTEKVNIASDIRKLLGGFGADRLTGSSGNDTLIGGPGGDVLIGGAGEDTVDYSATSTDNTVTACFETKIESCGAANDGALNEGDQVFQVEHLIGGSGVDTFSVLNNSAVAKVTFEGGAGNDVLTGGANNDLLSGDDGDDTLNGGEGDDTLTGGTGADILDGGGGTNLCTTDSSDSPPAVNCTG
ncbi:MAG TPA: calcium-binding protein [Polyangiales bacterium]|nr:calcium-binding protein [Polyangiales bacterium]